MASYNLRNFANPDVLRTIEEERLRALLAPYVEYLSHRGVRLWGEGARARAANGDVPTASGAAVPIDYEALAGALAEPDLKMPEALVTALYLIDEMATPEGMDELLALGDLVKIDESQEQTPADVATQVYLSAPRLLERTHAVRFVEARKSYRHFLSRSEPEGAFRHPGSAALVALESDLKSWFLKKKRGDDVRVFVYPKDAEAWILVRHGERWRREPAQAEGRSTVALYRPETHDVVVYDTAIGELRINAESEALIDLYRRALGLHLFGSDDHFPRTNKKYTLDPLHRDGPASLSCADIEGIEAVTLKEVQYYLGGAEGEVEIRKATGDLFAALAQRKRGVRERGIVGARFVVKFSDSRRARSVSLRPPNVAKFTRDHDGRLVDQWLRRRGFSAVDRRPHGDG